MPIKFLISTFVLLISFQLSSQEKFFSTFNIDPDLKKNANAVVRLDNSYINVTSFDKMLVKNRRVLTVLNSDGDSKTKAYVHYDKNVKIKKLEAIIYNSFGKEIKKIKEKDFIDVSAVSGSTLYSDSRVKYLDYTPIKYPYSIEYIEEYETSFTVYIPNWFPINSYNLSVESSNYKIENTSNVEMSINTKNIEDYNIEVKSKYNYSAKNIKAIKPEQYSLSFTKMVPSVKVAMNEFSMESVKGTNTNWLNFGKWMNDELVSNTQTLPQEAIDEVKELTKNATTNIEKAKIVYQYMQDKTRYISVQVGIGGWKPMLATDVDKLGYGDCKGLSNYTKALLNEVGVESYYTVIYGDRDLRNIDESFSSLQGNHVILSVPNNSDYIWLECTSQTSPFGYNANFTDDRDALIITPEGGKIVHTKIYNTNENVLDTQASITFEDTGDFTADININSYGTQYGYHDNLINKDRKDQDLYYKKYWSHINNLTIEKLNFVNNKDSVVFTENVKVKATKYASKTGDRFLLQPNFFNRVDAAPKRYINRKLPFEVERGFVDTDQYEITIPKALEVEAIMDSVSISNKFGEYSATVTKKNDKLVYKRKFKLNKGSYLKEEYNDFRDFWLQVIKSDNSKIVLKTKS